MQKRDGKVTIWASLFVFCLIPNAFAQKVLVNIWDGTEWEKVQSLYNAGKLPNAKRVGGAIHRLTANEECFSFNPDCPCMATETKPQHATMLTGYLADVHGVYTNRCYELIPSEGLNQTTRLWYTSLAG